MKYWKQKNCNKFGQQSSEFFFRFVTGLISERDGAKYFRNRPILLKKFEEQPPEYWINGLKDLDAVYQLEK